MSRSKQVELKSCPFCGGEGSVTHAVGEFWARCMTCEASTVLCGTETRAIIAWNTRAPSALPVGWKLVPVEPTEEMCEAGAPYTGADHGPCDPNECAEDTYRAMLSASPPEPGVK